MVTQMLRRLLPTLAIPLFAAGLILPAQAAPYCRVNHLGFSPDPEFRDEMAGPRSLEEMELEAYAQKLRRRGVDVTGVDYWNGCLQAFVRSPEGKIGMQFFDPNTLEPID